MLNFKTVAVAAVLALSSLSASADCLFTANRTIEVDKALNQYGGLSTPNFQTICQKINRAKARVVITANAVVLQGKSIGWAALFLADLNSPIATSDHMSMSTFVNSNASQDVANELMVAAINDALKQWDIDRAIESLSQERAAFLKAKK